MLTKITFRAILFMAVLLLIIPMIMSANGNREADKDNGITFGADVMILLEKVQSGELTMEAAQEEFKAIEKEYPVSSEDKAQIQKMIKDVESGEQKAADCEEPLKEQLQAHERNKEKIQDGTADQTQLKLSEGQGGSEKSASEGSGNSGSTNKK